MNELIYKGDFCGKPRMTRGDRANYRPVVRRYWAYKELIKNAARKQKFKMGDQHEVKFFIQMPKSWSKKKKSEMCGKPHRSRPDLDNLQKGIWDALLHEDSTVWSVWATKYWWHENKIIVRNFEEPIAD